MRTMLMSKRLICCRNDLLNEGFTRTVRFALPWRVLSILLLLHAITPPAAISQIPTSPSNLRIGEGTTTDPPPTATGNTYYVATNGSDTNSGTHTQPFRTIRKAYGLAIPGDTIIVKPGIYTEYKSNYGIHLDRSGTALKPITIKSESKWQAIIEGGNKTDRPSGFYISKGNYNVIDGFEIRNASREGIVVRGNYNKILNNNIHSNGNYGDPTSGYGQDGIFSAQYTRGSAYVGNYIHRNGRLPLGSVNLDHGLYLCGDDELVANNIVVFNSSYGLHVAGYDTVSNLKVYNNIFAHNGRSGIVLWKAFDGVDIRNNISYKNARHAIRSSSATGGGVVVDRNLFFGNISGVMDFTSGSLSYSLGTNYTQDPQFVSDTSDFRLKSTSPAIDQGVNIAEVPVDFAGAVRPRGARHDIGAYEY